MFHESGLAIVGKNPRRRGNPAFRQIFDNTRSFDASCFERLVRSLLVGLSDAGSRCHDFSLNLIGRTEGRMR